MQTILQLNTSLSGAAGQSSRLASEFVATLGRTGGARVTIRDLASQPVPHLTRTLEQQRCVAESDALIDELRRADVVVIGLPMYNFGVPSTLKAYFDHAARAGVTFRYTPDGPVGLLAGKKVYVVATRGGRHAGTPGDLQTAYVRRFLGFIGLRDVEFIYVEGLALGAEHREAAFGSALERIGQLAA